MATYHEKLKDLLRNAFILMKRQWFHFAVITLIFYVPMDILDNYFWSETELGNLSIAQPSSIATSIIDGVIIFLVCMFFFLYLIAVMKMIHAADQGRKAGALAAYGQAIAIFHRYLWVKIIYAFNTLCWSVLLVIPGIIYGVFTSFSGLALLIDHKQGAEALTFSRSIIKPKWARYCTTILYLLIILIAYCVLFISSLDGIIYLFRVKGNWIAARAIDYVEIAIVAMAGFYFLISYYYLYKDLKQEAAD